MKEALSLQFNSRLVFINFAVYAYYHLVEIRVSRKLFIQQTISHPVTSCLENVTREQNKIKFCECANLIHRIYFLGRRVS